MKKTPIQQRLKNFSKTISPKLDLLILLTFLLFLPIYVFVTDFIAEGSFFETQKARFEALIIFFSIWPFVVIAFLAGYKRKRKIVITCLVLLALLFGFVDGDRLVNFFWERL